MPDNNLTLLASVKDNASGPLRKIAREATELTKVRVDAATSSFTRLSNTISPLAGQTRQVVGSMNLLGFATGGVITGLAAAASALNEFSKKSLAIRDFSKLTSLSTAEIGRFTEASKRLGIDPEQSTAGLRVFSRNLADLKNRTGDLRAHLTRRGAGDIAGELTRLTQAGNNAGALDLVIKKIKQLSDAGKNDEAARFAGDMFGDEELYKLYRYNDALKGLKPALERNYEAAQKYRDNWITAESNVTRFRNRLMGELLPAFNDLSDAAEKIDLGKLIADDVTDFIKKLSEAIKDLRDISKGDFSSITPKFEKGGFLDRLFDPMHQKQLSLTGKQKELNDTDEALKTTKPGFYENLLKAQRERLAKEISDLVEQIKKLSTETSATVKKMSFMNGSGGLGTAGGLTNISFGGFGQAAAAPRGWGGGGYANLGEGGGSGSAPAGSNSPSGSGGGISANPMGRGAADGIASTSQGFRGNATAVSKAAIMDQLRKNGVPEANLEHAASALVGQAKAESGLNPNTSHDSGTGYGIYGARNKRAASMLKWLGENGYEKNSLEGQSRYMAHEAMNDKTYAKSRAALMGANANNLEQVTDTLTRNFEAPKINNTAHRYRQTLDALREKPAGAETASGEGGGINARAGDIPKVRGVDPRIQSIINTAAGSLPDGYKVRMTSGNRGEGNHNGNAADYQIIGPDGKVLSNRGEDPSGMYTRLARLAKTAQQQNHPELNGRFAWGGAFGTQKSGGGQRDLMHFDINGERGRYAQYQLRNMKGLPLQQNSPTDTAWRYKLDKGQGNEMTSKVEGTGKLTVDVNAPKGTRVGAEGGGLFKQIELSRNTQMGQAADASSERMAPQ